MEGCEDVKMNQITLQDAADIAEIYKDCHNVTVNKVVVNAGASDRKAISISGCDGVKMTDCYFNMTGNPLESAGTSRNLIFTNCVTPDGKAVSKRSIKGGKNYAEEIIYQTKCFMDSWLCCR